MSDHVKLTYKLLQLYFCVRTISELSEELSRKKELETLKKDNEQLDIKIKEHEKMEVKYVS